MDDMLKVRHHGCARQNLSHGSLSSKPTQAAHSGSRENHGAHFMHVQASDNCVLHIGRTGGDDLAAQRTHAHKSASGEFEVFSNASVKFETLVDVVFIDPLHCIASAKKAFFVKSFLGFLRSAPVARGDVWAFVAHFDFVAVGNEFEFHPWGGHAQVARFHKGAGDKDGKWARLGHPQACAHDDALADFAFLAFVQAVPNGLRQCSARIEKHLDAAEQVFAQSIIGFHGDGDGFKTCGHIEVHRGRNLA